jgi:hypothetical protein
MEMMLLVALFLLAAVQGSGQFPLHADTEYVLNVPPGYDRWALSGQDGGADWCYASRGRPSDIASLCFDKKPTYASGTSATVELIGDASVKVVLKDGRTGWVARELIGMTPEQKRAYETEQGARAKRVAEAKAQAAKRVAEARAKEAEKEAKERAFIATLPKLRSGSSEVLVATSGDCARDYKGIIEFGRRNGTGIEYRKKVLELISLGCATNLPSGTAINISRRDRDFVTFCAYDGPKRGTCGVALSEHVH